MAIFSGKGSAKLVGKKELTKDLEVNVLKEPKLIYVPLVIGPSTDFEVHVSEGDTVSVGTKLATRKDMYVPLYSPVSGIFKGIEKKMHASGRPQNHMVIENDMLQTTVPAIHDGKLNVDELSREQLIELIKEAGMLGLGGSGFPTFFKYQTAKDVETIVINGVECEPYITSDFKLMEKEVHALLDGTSLFMRAAGAQKAIIAVKVGKPELVKEMRDAAVNFSGIEIREVPDAYPMGWERVLIRQLFKKEYERFPGEVGVVVNNATTAIYVSKAIREGLAVTHRIVTISGEGIKHPQNVYVPVGTPVDYIIEQIGGYGDIEEGIVIAGGPMMGKPVLNDTFVITEYSNAITVLPKAELEELPCLRCGLCTEHCPAKIQPVQIMAAEKNQDIERLMKCEALRCIECGLCSFVCPSKIEVTDWVAKAKRRLALAKK